MMEHIKKLYNTRLQFDKKPGVCPVCGSEFISDFCGSRNAGEEKAMSDILHNPCDGNDRVPDWRCEECEKSFYRIRKNTELRENEIQPYIDDIPQKIKEIIGRNLWWELCEEYDIEHVFVDVYQIILNELMEGRIDYFKYLLEDGRLFLKENNICYKGKYYTMDSMTATSFFSHIVQRFEEESTRIWS